MTTTEILQTLRANAEGAPFNGWCMVYLDNAIPAGMNRHAFAGFLSALTATGDYRPVDGFAFGEVKVD